MEPVNLADLTKSLNEFYQSNKVTIDTLGLSTGVVVATGILTLGCSWAHEKYQKIKHKGHLEWAYNTTASLSYGIGRFC